MPDTTPSNLSSQTSLEKLQTREKLLKAVIYVAGSFIVAIIGYAVYRLVSHQVESWSELVSRNSFLLASFGASLLLATQALKKTRAELSARRSRADEGHGHA